MREDKHRNTAGLQNAMEGLHGSLQIRRVHEHVVRDDHVKFGVTYCYQSEHESTRKSLVGSFRRAIAIIRSAKSMPVTRAPCFASLITNTRYATGIKDPKSTNVAHELPENGI